MDYTVDIALMPDSSVRITVRFKDPTTAPHVYEAMLKAAEEGVIHMEWDGPALVKSEAIS